MGKQMTKSQVVAHLAEKAGLQKKATGELLARHFPKSGGVPNELPDEIAED